MCRCGNKHWASNMDEPRPILPLLFQGVRRHRSRGNYRNRLSHIQHRHHDDAELPQLVKKGNEPEREDASPRRRINKQQHEKYVRPNLCCGMKDSGGGRQFRQLYNAPVSDLSLAERPRLQPTTPSSTTA